MNATANSIIHVWEAEDPEKKTGTNEPFKHKIRKHKDGHFSVVSCSYPWGTIETYGPFKNLDEAKKFLQTYDQIPLDAWKQIS